MDFKGKWITSDFAPDYDPVIFVVTPKIEPTRDGLITFSGIGPSSGPGSAISFFSVEDYMSMDIARDVKSQVRGSFTGTAIDEDTIEGTLEISENGGNLSRTATFKRAKD